MVSPGAALSMFGVSRTAWTTSDARVDAAPVMAVETSVTLWPCGATICAFALTPSAVKRRSELFRASSRRLVFLSKLTVTYPTCTPAAVAKL